MWSLLGLLGMLRLPGTNNAKVKDIVDLRKFVAQEGLSSCEATPNGFFKGDGCDLRVSGLRHKSAGEPALNLELSSLGQWLEGR